MATRVKRSYVSDFAKHGMNYLFRRDQISPLEKERNREKAWLKEYIEEHGQRDSNGNINVYFERDGEVKFVPGPGSTEYWGLQQRRSPGAEYMDEDEVKKFMDEISHRLPEDAGKSSWLMTDTRDEEIYRRVVREVTTEIVDTEELYKMYHEKLITKAQIRKLIHHHPDSYQLWPITEPPIEDDES